MCSQFWESACSNNKLWCGFSLWMDFSLAVFSLLVVHKLLDLWKSCTIKLQVKIAYYIMHNAHKICIVLKCCIFIRTRQVVVHALILHCSLFIVHWPCFIVQSFHNIVHPNVQNVVHSANCTIVHNSEQFVPTLICWRQASWWNRIYQTQMMRNCENRMNIFLSFFLSFFSFFLFLVFLFIKKYKY